MNEKDVANTIEQTIHAKIQALREDNWKPWCMILNEKAYIALCSKVENWSIESTTPILDLEIYRNILVVLDVNAIEDVKVLRRPHEELVYK